jgi:hypothetical protein
MHSWRRLGELSERMRPTTQTSRRALFILPRSELMSDGQSTTTETVKKIDELLQTDDLTTRSGLRLSMSALRDAMKLIDKVDANLDEMKIRVDVMWQTHRMIKWAVGILGTSLLLLVFSLLTGQAHLSFGNP